MSDIKKTLRGIIDYLCHNRQAGHTTAALEGVYHVDNARLVTHNIRFASEIFGWLSRARDKVLTLDSFTNSSAMSGCKDPIVFDNAAIQILAADALKKIEAQEREIADLNRQLEEARAELQKEIYDEQIIIIDTFIRLPIPVEYINCSISIITL